MSPFLVLYGREAPLLPSFAGLSSSIEVVSNDLQCWAAIIAVVKKKMKQSQIYMKDLADKKREEMLLTVGSWVMVWL